MLDEAQGNESFLLSSTIPIDEGHDIIDGGDGNDTIYAGQGNDNIYGGDGNDTIYAGDGNDIIYGGRGVDTIFWSSGNDIIDGGLDEDTLELQKYSFSDIITMNINNGYVLEFENNVLNLSNIENISDASGQIRSANRLFNDVNDIEEISQPVLNIINGDENDNTISGTDEGEIINGLAGNDTINGNDGNDFIYGGSGDDILSTVDENSHLYGDEGNDILIINGIGSMGVNGGEGSDTLIIDTTNFIPPDVEDFRLYISVLDGITGGIVNGELITNDTLTSIENIELQGQISSIIEGDSNNNILMGGDGRDTIISNGGMDIVSGGLSNDWFQSYKPRTI